MDIDFSAITNNDQYKKDIKKLSTTGRKRALQIWMLIIMILVPVFWPVLIYLLIKWRRKGKLESSERIRSITDFAKTNNFKFLDNVGKFINFDTGVQKNHKLPFDVEKVFTSNELSGELMGHPFVYSMSSVFVKSGNSFTQYPYNLFTIELPVMLPSIFINSKLNNLKGLDAGAINFEESEDHQLEGDFPDFYNVRIEKDEHIDMYTILTPEVMDSLKRNNYYDVWLYENQLTLITFADQARYYAGIHSVFENAASLMKEIDVIARSIRKLN